MSESAMGPGIKTGVVFNIQRFSVQDGPGIRTTVFLKGCPLHCQWCSNAESINPQPELGVIRGKCNGCGRCVEVCPEDAASLDDGGGVQFDRERCTACGECVPVCFSEALIIYGKQMTIDDVFDIAVRDRAFYGSDGGVTVSGGEPLRQAEFVAGLFERCRKAGIGTCLDTCGNADTEKLREVLELTSHVLYDLKHMNTERHQRFTGAPNRLIIKNARVVAESGTPMLCRIPLVSGVNDTEGNVVETARFVRELGNGIGVELLPYHRLGIGKYGMLGRVYQGEELVAPSSQRIEWVRALFEEHGVPCSVGG